MPASLPPLDEARALVAKNDIAGAMDKLGQLLNGDFYHPEALFMLGACFMERGMNGVGYVMTAAAVEAKQAREGKAYPEALLNLGAACKKERQNDKAERIWLDALQAEKLPRELSKIATNIAGLYVNEGNPLPAIDWCDRAIELDAANHGAWVNRGMACLELGRWREGWEGFRHTYASGDRTPRRYAGIPEWKGEPGKTVIGYGDQGVGDEIFNASCLPDMIRRCKKVILDCHPRLETLFRRSFPEVEVHGTRKHLSQVDWLDDSGAEASCCLADLPRFFRNEDADWGDGTAYLKADTGKDAALWYGAHAPAIGLSWSGGTKRTRADLRSVPLEALEPIIRSRPEAQWFSLQYTENAAHEVCQLEEKTGVRISHYPGWVECFDYDRTASFVASLDVIITVCTTVHHLAGALGIPVWTLVPSRPSWRYGLQGRTVPWYRSACLFRQERDGVWNEPIARIADALRHRPSRWADAAC